MQTVGGTLKPLQCTKRHYPKGTFTPQRLEPRAGYIKLSSLPWKGTQEITPKKERDNRVFLIIPYLSHNLVLTLALKVLWQAPHRWSLTPEGVLLIIQASKPEVESPWVFITWLTKLRFINLAPFVGTIARFNQVVANNLYVVQSRFCSLGATNLGASGHRRRTN